MATHNRLLLAVFALLIAAIAGVVALHRRHELPAYADDAGPEPAGLKPAPVMELRSNDSGAGMRYWIRNLVDGPIQAECSLVGAQNAYSVPSLPRRLVVPASSERELVAIRAQDAQRRSSAEVRCEAVLGDPDAQVDADASYAQPFYPNTAFVVGQGYNGAFSHHTPDSRYAIDLGVPEGTPVVAARDGVVMQVEDEFRGHGVDIGKYGDRANYILILHADGSMALYAHLAPDTALVRQGDKVKAGHFLARAGNTGFSTGPHLHFAVQHNAGMALESIPFRMAGVDPGPP